MVTWNSAVGADGDGVRAVGVVNERGKMRKMCKSPHIRPDVIKDWLAAGKCGRVKSFENGVW